MSVQARILGALIGVEGAGVLARLSLPWQWRPYFEASGNVYGVDPDLLHAISLTENPGQDPNAIGAPNRDGTRDYGAMQINEVNFVALGLGTVAQGLWRDPARSIAAAAQLVASNRQRVPNASAPDELSMYNAGVSTLGPHAKVTAAGRYINEAYVWRGVLWLWAVKLASLVPALGVQRTT